MSVSGFISLQAEVSDINIFSVEDDLFSPDSLVQEFNQKKISNQIEVNAYRAKQVVEAQAQLMLARYQAETPDAVIEYQNKAESIAYELGRAEFNGIETPTNPFDEPALSSAWNNGYSHSAHLGKPQNQLAMERRFWEEGIDTESENSQFELAAITLYNLALKTTDETIANRCKRLAFEMASYGNDFQPTPKRQQQINTFMAKQTERLAQAIDFKDF